MTQATPPQPPFLFGANSRQARAALKQIQESYPRTEASELVRSVSLIAAFPVLHTALLELLLSSRLAPATASHVSEALVVSPSWTLEERARIAHWLHDCACGGWGAMLSEEHEQFPLAVLRKSAVGAELAGRASLHLPTPSGLFLEEDFALTLLGSSPGAPLDAERYAAAVVRVHREPSAQTARELLRAAKALSFDGVVAGLFAGPMLESIAQEEEVLSAFHECDWGRYGTAKIGFARRTVLSPVPSAESARRRWLAVQLWARGRDAEASELLAQIVASEPAPSAALLREFLTATATSGARPSKMVRKAISDLQSFDPLPREVGWLELLCLHTGRVGGMDGRQIAKLREMDLPLRSDPLFVPLAARLRRMLATNASGEEAWGVLCARFDAIEPGWRSHVPWVDTQYIGALGSLRAAGSDPLRVGVALRALLLLPADLGWLRDVLALLQTGDRGALLLDEDDCPTTLGSLVIDLCIRAVEVLIAGGTHFSASVTTALVSGNPMTVVGALFNALTVEAL